MVNNKKTLKLVVCMSLIIALALSALGLTVRAVYENTHYNSGDQANDIVGIATTQVGYYEGDGGYTKYGDWYGLPYSDWCAMFVSWCADQAKVSTNAFPRFALCSAGADWFINEGRFHYAGSYTPQAGDLIFYASYGNIYHVGLVTGSDGSNVYSIEGNYNEAVYNVSYPLSYGDIMGYATPAYETGAAVQPEPETKVEPEPAVEEESDEDEIAADSEIVVRYDDEEEPEVIDTDSEEELGETDTSVEEDTEEAEDTEETEEPEENATDSEDSDTLTVVPDTHTSALIGDVDGDGEVNAADALLIQIYISGDLNDGTSFNYLNADVNASGEIDIQDAVLALKISVKAA